VSRDFDSFEIDDFRDLPWEPESCRTSRERGGSSQTEASPRLKLQRLREIEFESDQRSTQSREHREAKPPSSSRDTRQADSLARRERTEIRDRDRSYSLRPSEIHTLTEVGKFRVVALEDLGNYAYSGDRSRMDSDLRNLIRQGLVGEETRTYSKRSPSRFSLLPRKKANASFVATAPYSTTKRSTRAL
jgi:hypothetical protein